MSEIGESIYHSKRKNNIETITGNQECMKAFFINSAIDTVAWGKLYKRELFNTVKYPYGKYHEDVWTTYLLIAQSKKIVISYEKKYFYRHRINSISKKTFTEKHLDSVHGAIERKNFIKNNYPELLSYANSSIVYAANQCLLKMLQAKVNKKEYVDFLSIQYKKYEKDFLKGKSSIKAKIFSLIAFLNINLIIKKDKNHD